MNIELTENSYIYQSAKRLLNRELEKCTKLLKENEKAWNESMNLKLYDASTENIDFEHNDAKVSFSDEEQSRWFYMFCDWEFDCFMDWCSNDGIDFNKLKDNIGNTSSFYLGRLHNNERSDDKYLIALTEAINELNNTWLEFKVEKDIIMFDEDAACWFTEL